MAARGALLPPATALPREEAVVVAVVFATAAAAGFGAEAADGHPRVPLTFATAPAATGDDEEDAAAAAAAA